MADEIPTFLQRKPVDDISEEARVDSTPATAEVPEPAPLNATLLALHIIKTTRLRDTLPIGSLV